MSERKPLSGRLTVDDVWHSAGRRNQYRVDQRRIALQQGGKIRLCSPRHHHLQPQLRPRHPHEQAPACCLVGWSKSTSASTTPMALCPLNRCTDSIRARPRTHRFPVGRISPRNLPQRNAPSFASFSRSERPCPRALRTTISARECRVRAKTPLPPASRGAARARRRRQNPGVRPRRGCVRLDRPPPSSTH